MCLVRFAHKEHLLNPTVEAIVQHLGRDSGQGCLWSGHASDVNEDNASVAFWKLLADNIVLCALHTVSRTALSAIGSTIVRWMKEEVSVDRQGHTMASVTMDMLRDASCHEVQGLFNIIVKELLSQAASGLGQKASRKKRRTSKGAEIHGNATKFVESLALLPVSCSGSNELR